MNVFNYLKISQERYLRLRDAGFSDDELMFCTDKVNHGYMPTYHQLSTNLNSATAVCEIGVLNGGSLRMLQYLFPEASVVGVDNDSRCAWPVGTERVISDQCDPQLKLTLQRLNQAYDLIIDDASHIASKSQITLELLWGLVAPKGYYVIEDWQVAFPGNEYHDELGPGWLDLAKSFIEVFALDSCYQDVKSVKYENGLIVMEKRQ